MKEVAKKSSIKKLYEDEHVVVINKPAGLMAHPDGRSKEKTVVDWIKRNYPEIKDVGEPFLFEESGKKKKIARPGIVHRLDKDTSGILLICKTEEAFRKLKSQFKNHTVKKVYRALVWGYIRQETGIIDEPIARSKSDFRVRTVPNHFDEDSRGVERNAVTRYKVLGKYFYEYKGKKFPLTYVELLPMTGRTHQLRVHCKAMRHPIIGDSLYGPEGFPEIIARTALHAFKLTFLSPKAGIQTIECPPPQDLNDALAKLTKV